MLFRILKAFVILSFIITLPLAHAEDKKPPQLITINVNASHYLQLDQPILRVASGSAEIIGLVELKPSLNELLIVAKKPGATSLFVWTEDGIRHEYVVNVSPEDPGQALLIQQAINLPNVKVKMVGSRILLSGKVRNQYEREYAIKIAQLYIGGGSVSSISNSQSVGANRGDTDDEISNDVTSFSATGNTNGSIIDLLELEHPTQINFEAQIIEIASDATKDLGLQYSSGTSGAAGTFYSGESNGTSSTSFSHNPIKWLTGNRSPIDVTLNLLIQNDKARILSRPNITTMSGEAASIHIGGQIPIPIVDDGEVGYEMQDYGIILKIVPTVDARDRITSDVTAIVSSLDYAHTTQNNSSLIPGLTVREATAVINVNSGMTMAIGGLLDSTDSKTIVKVPILGDIPILGEFFRHTRKLRDKRELLILITPTLVTDETPARMSDGMHDLYSDGRQEKRELYHVDLNDSQSPPPSEDEFIDVQDDNEYDTPFDQPEREFIKIRR